MPQASSKDNLTPVQAASGVIVILIWNSKTAAPHSPQGVANPDPSQPGVGGGEEQGPNPSSSWACQQFGKTRRILPEWPLPRMPFDPRVMGCRAQTSHSPRPKAWDRQGTDNMWHSLAGGPTTRYSQSSTSVPRPDNRREGAGQISSFVLLLTLVQGPRVPGTQRLCS